MNQGYTYRERIDRRAAGRVLLDYLADRYRHASRQGWREHLAAGRVTLDAAVADGSEVLRKKQRLHYARAPWVEPVAPLEFAVLADGPGWIAVDKPSGLPTLPGGGFLEHTLLHQLRLAHPGASPLHRLGRFTSGVVLCGLDKATSARLTAHFGSRSVHKRYRALVSGNLAQDVQIDVPIGPVPYAPLGTVHAACAEGRAASSSVTVVQQDARGTLVDVVIQTGRPHQIRIHLAAVGHPLVGDPLYVSGGLPAPHGTAVPGDPGYALHAVELRFEDVVISAPLPAWGIPG